MVHLAVQIGGMECLEDFVPARHHSVRPGRPRGERPGGQRLKAAESPWNPVPAREIGPAPSSASAANRGPARASSTDRLPRPARTRLARTIELE